MRAVLQRVSRAQVSVAGRIIGKIDRGWLVLLGAAGGDERADVAWLCDKILNLRGFSDDAGKMNRTVAEVGGAILVVSQFTLLADCRRGRRPSFTDAAPAEVARHLYMEMIAMLGKSPVRVASGEFQADMQVELTNDGPVTFVLDSRAPNLSHRQQTEHV